MQITFVTRKFQNVERNLHCDVLHITTVRVARLVLDCNGVFAIKAYGTHKHRSITVTDVLTFDLRLKMLSKIIVVLASRQMLADVFQ